MTFDAKAKVSKSRAAIERAQESASKKKSPSYGVYYVAEPKVMDGGEMPTRDEWLNEQSKKTGVKNQSSKFDTGRGESIVQGRK